MLSRSYSCRRSGMPRPVLSKPPLLVGLKRKTPSGRFLLRWLILLFDQFIDLAWQCDPVGRALGLGCDQAS